MADDHLRVCLAIPLARPTALLFTSGLCLVQRESPLCGERVEGGKSE